MTQRILHLVAAFALAGASWHSTAQTVLPTARSTRFSGSGNCTLCHQSNGTANTSAAGGDVSQPTTWRGTMMAHAVRDPYWQAAVAAEVRRFPALREVIEDKCTNCHAPMGHAEAHAAGGATYALATATGDPLASDAVSCTLCHQIEPDNFGTLESYSGGFLISTNRVTYGPFQNPVGQAMQTISGFAPVFSAHISQPDLCGTCHTLFTPFVDNNGAVAGEFPEQTPLLEWRASVYPAQNTTCQTCHVPADPTGSPIATIPSSAPVRTPRRQHHFVGGNAFMLRIMRDNATALGATADPVHYDSAIARTERQITGAVRLSANAVHQGGPTVEVDVRLENLAGHKFPTGFPSRRAWLRVEVRDRTDQPVFVSGQYDDNGDIAGTDDEVEPHYDLISQTDQVQIYEAVPGDVDGEVTQTLLRAATYLKDNRLPPLGFPEAAMIDDTVGVHGDARNDPTFNRTAGTAGSGSDEVRYSISVDPAAGPFTVVVELYYQSVSPAFMHEVTEHDDPAMLRMRAMHTAADRRPQLVQRITRSTLVGVEECRVPVSLRIGALHPNPIAEASTAQLEIEAAQPGLLTLEIISALGSVVERRQMPVSGGRVQSVTVPTAQLPAGVYHCRVSMAGSAALRSFIVMH